MPPVPSKKNKVKSSQKIKKKTATPKTSSHLRRDLIIATILIASVVAAATGFFWREENIAAVAPSTKLHKPAQPKEANSNLSNIQKSTQEENKTLPVKEGIEKKIDISAQIDKQREAAMNAAYDDMPLNVPPPPTIASIKQGKRPKLVIIIDDVAHPSQLRQILSIPLKLTPSIFPPSAITKEGANMARSFSHSMIHLPVEAPDHPKNAMPDTIVRHDSKEKMQLRVKQLRKWFPEVVYVNNHTGSTFTADSDALMRLYGLLKQEHFVFVDSRTSPKTQGERVAKAYGDIYLGRDIFIDNTQQFGAIREELKSAIKQAKKRGYAVAIGHPYPITIRSLKNSLDILVDVDVVYMDELVRQK